MLSLSLQKILEHIRYNLEILSSYCLPNKARTAGCVRSAIFNGGKCYLTTEGEGEYACKTCWNTNHFCVAWDDESKYFWIRPQLPAVRSKKTVGPFDLERFRSMKDGPTRQKLPPYWQESFTP